MAKEASLVMRRRFLGRILESGLLMIAVALGVGAAAAGLSLLFHTKEYSDDLLKSAEYREIVVSTRSNAEDMEFPFVERTEEETVLTSNDLKAGELIDEVAYSYITTNTRLRFITEDSNMPGQGGGPGGQQPQQESNNQDQKSNNKQQGNNNNNQDDERMQQMAAMMEEAKKISNNPDYIVPEVDEINGLEITEQFFNAWNLDTTEGSIFTMSDFSSRKNIIVLGSKAADLLNVQEYDSLVGKKLLAFDGVFTVVGVLEESGTNYDGYFYTPKQELSGGGQFTFRRGPDNSLLRFYVTDLEKLDAVAEQLNTYYENIYGEGQVEVSNPREEALRVVDRNSGISLLILFLSLSGLFIASVNVSNILISRALRMRKHVGILKALGASRVAILKLFVKESLTVTFIGALLGTGLAIPLAINMEEALGLGSVSYIYIILGVLIASFVTLLFTVLPARQNMDIEAAEAMRVAG